MSDDTIKSVVRRLIRNCTVAGLSAINAQDVIEMRNKLHQICGNTMGLQGSLVYSPRDLSVYVRTELLDGTIVDVALCTQDVTSNSNVRLNNLNLAQLDLRVGDSHVIEALPEVHNLSPIVQEVVERRFVHRIVRFPRSGDGPFTYTVELARTYNPIRDMIFQINVPALELWGNDVHERFAFTTETEDIFCSWLICMTLFEQNKVDQPMREDCQQILRESEESLKRPQPEMSRHVNYESLFRSNNKPWHQGRFIWPVLLAFCTCKNLTQDGFRELPRDYRLASMVGTYRGRYTFYHIVSIGITIVGFLIVVLIPLLGILLGSWTTKVLSIVVSASITLYGMVMICTNAFFLEDPRAWVQFVRCDDPDVAPICVNRGDSEIVPIMVSDETAVRVLLSDACRKHYNGRNLCFTGDEYTGTHIFPATFTYLQLCQIGFTRLADSAGREYLRVPRSGKLVRMTHSVAGSFDHFEVVENEPPRNLLFAKNWFSRNVPGALERTIAEYLSSMIQRRHFPSDHLLPVQWRSDSEEQACTELSKLFICELLDDKNNPANAQLFKDLEPERANLAHSVLVKCEAQSHAILQSAKVFHLVKLIWKFRMFRDVNDPRDTEEGFMHLRRQAVRCSDLYHTSFDERPQLDETLPEEGNLYVALSYMHYSLNNRLNEEDITLLSSTVAMCEKILGKSVYVWWDSRANEKTTGTESCVVSDFLQHGIRPYYQLPVLALTRNAQDPNWGTYETRLWTCIESDAAKLARGVIYLDAQEHVVDPNKTFLAYSPDSPLKQAVALLTDRYNGKRASFEGSLQQFRAQAFVILRDHAPRTNQ